MSRINPNTTPDAKTAEMLDGVKKQLGSVPNIFATLAHSPAALGFYLQGSATLGGTALSARLREQLALTVAGANACDYCASAHTVFGRMRKIDDAELARNLAGRSDDAKTQAALTFARRIIDTRGHVADADLAALRDAGYSDAEAIEIVAVTALNIFTNYFNSIAGTEVDFPRVTTAAATQAA